MTVSSSLRIAVWSSIVLLLAGCRGREEQLGQTSQACTSGSGPVVFAYRSLSLGSHATVSGDLAVRDKESDAAVELSVGAHAEVTGSLRADSVVLADHVRVDGLLTSNELVLGNHVSLGQPAGSPLALPLADLTPLVPAVTPGTQSITVAAKATQALAAGTYGAVTLRAGNGSKATTLRLLGGLYQLASLTLEERSRLECTATCEVRIAGRLEVARKSELGPAPASLGPAALTIFVLAADASAARLGRESTITARLVAPVGTIVLDDRTEALGLLIGRAVLAGDHVVLRGGGTVLPPDAGVPRDAGPRPDLRRDLPRPVVDLRRPDLPRPDLPRADLPRPDRPRPDAPALDRALPDAPHPDAALPDLARSDLTPPDAPRPDLPCGTHLGPAGGSVLSADGKAELVVPAGALSQTVCLRLEVAAAPPAGAIDGAYVLVPDATSFASPATLRLSYDPATLGSTPEASLALARVGSGAWQVLASTVDLTAHKVSAPVDGSGTFGLVPSRCGDGVVSGTEQCESGDLRGQSCLTLGFTGGSLACSGACAFDTSACTSCTPATCASLGKNCGALPDGCGGSLSCGTCTPPQTCGGSGVANVCGCTPTSCAAQGKDCGAIPDSCGGTLSCGTCVPPQSCGGSGVANLCGCTPTSCAAQGKDCGGLADGCGGTLDCGVCAPPQSCGGSGVANLCGCTPTTCAAQLVSCGPLADGCGGTLDCGVCTPPLTCGGSGVAGACGCTPTTCTALGLECGSAPDGCGGMLDCGTCSAPQTCGGGGLPGLCGCTPTTCAAAGATCGTLADGCGGTLSCGTCALPDACGGGGVPNRCGVSTPPDPATVAPPTEPGVATSAYAASSFLWSGPSPIQTGVSAGTIDPARAGLVRGRVLDAAGAPRPGVTLTVVNHPELGSTRSRADGWFDLAVNGGGTLTVRYSAAGLLTVDRKVTLLWHEGVVLEDVVMVPADPEVTPIASLAPAMQVARGSTSSDSSGTRQATLLFPAGTAATLVHADGTTEPLPTLHVRPTELTVGARGPQRMPADLPPTVAYTYALEVSVDEAVAASAPSVTFSSPVVLYVENSPCSRPSDAPR